MLVDKLWKCFKFGGKNMVMWKSGTAENSKYTVASDIIGKQSSEKYELNTMSKALHIRNDLFPLLYSHCQLLPSERRYREVTASKNVYSKSWMLKLFFLPFYFTVLYLCIWSHVVCWYCVPGACTHHCPAMFLTLCLKDHFPNVDNKATN